MKPYVVPLVMVLFAFFVLPPALAETDPPDTVAINNDGYQPDRKGPVHFSHTAHADQYGVSCEVCHHEYEDGVNGWTAGEDVLSCNACHEANTGDAGILRLKMAYHKSCQGCHKEKASGKRGDAPYNRCNACHKKK